MQMQATRAQESGSVCHLKRHERLVVADSTTLLAEAIATAALAHGYGNARVASGSANLLRLIDQCPPTLLLADIDLAARDDFSLLRSISERAPDIKVVLMIDGRMEPNLAVEALVHGVDGLACRDQGISSLLRVLDLVRSGEVVVPRHLTALLVQTLRQRPARHAGAVQLSTRQREVLRLLATGATDKDICRQLNISLTTVRSHLAAIFEKTETGNRTAAALWASTYLDQAAG